MNRSKMSIVITLSVLILTLGIIGSILLSSSDPVAEQALSSNSMEVKFSFESLDITTHIEQELENVDDALDKNYILWYIDHYDKFLFASTEWFNKLDIENNPYSDQKKFLEDLENTRIKYSRLSQEVTIKKVNERPNAQYLNLSYDAYYDAAKSISEAIDIASASYHRGYISEYEKSQLQELYNEIKNQLDYSSYKIVKYFELLPSQNELDRLREQYKDEPTDTPVDTPTNEPGNSPIFHEENGTLYIYGVTLGQSVDEAIRLNGDPINSKLDEGSLEEMLEYNDFSFTHYQDSITSIQVQVFNDSLQLEFFNVYKGDMYISQYNDFYFYPPGSDHLLVLKENEDPTYGYTGYLLYVDDNFLFGIQDGYILPFEG